MPNVSRRLAAVLATAVAASAMTLLAAAGSTSRSAQNRTAYARVLAAPTAANRTSWVLSRSGASVGRPVASRHKPRRSSIAVATMSTRESGSSVQSTGSSWMRRPARSARTSSSVSKNQLRFTTSGSRLRATSARSALDPQHADLGQFLGELGGDRRRRVGARVVRDGDAGGEGKLLCQIRVQAEHARAQLALLVVHGDGDVDHGARSVGGDRLAPARQRDEDPDPQFPGFGRNNARAHGATIRPAFAGGL